MVKVTKNNGTVTYTQCYITVNGKQVKYKVYILGLKKQLYNYLLKNGLLNTKLSTPTKPVPVPLTKKQLRQVQLNNLQLSSYLTKKTTIIKG